MAECIQCPNGKWICGTGLQPPDCGNGAGPGALYGRFTVDNPGTFEIYLRPHPKDPDDHMIEIVPVP
jgi:hypothetical protein